MTRRILRTSLLATFGSLLFGVFFSFIGIKIFYRLAYLFGRQGPCPPLWGWTLEIPTRVARIPQMLDWMGVQPHERVLEIGTGPGVYTVPLAQRLEAEGQLFAVDIQPAMIERVEQRLRQANIERAQTCVADAYQLPLMFGSVDRVLLVDVLPEMHDPQRVLKEIARVLTVHGQLAVTGEFADPDYWFAHEMIRGIEASGHFRAVQKHGNWWRYTLIFEKVLPARVQNPKIAAQ